ncbi:MAG: ABC transporter permease subunit [Clostridiales bacterium]|jgi:putative aldouronate transport system permease protein|nr:ABC transporter permease subunit [Clostridiales bacterium]
MTVSEAEAGAKRGRLQSLPRRVWEARYIYLVILPGLVFFAIFKYIPIYGIQLAFKKLKIGSGIAASPWIGTENFEYLFINMEFWMSVRNTLIIGFMQIILFFPFPVALAILLNEIRAKRFKRVVQTLYTLPHFLSWVVVSGIAINFFSMQGAFNNLLAVAGLQRHQFLTDQGVFRYLLVFSQMWKESGWNAILYLAAITAIDPALHEAATIDGANRWQRIKSITWPGISMIVVVTLILRVGSLLEVGFDQILNMYNPAVYDVADIIDTYIYRITFQRPANFGVSTAVGLFKGLTNCILLLSANWVSVRVSGAGIMD